MGTHCYRQLRHSRGSSQPARKSRCLIGVCPASKENGSGSKVCCVWCQAEHIVQPVLTPNTETHHTQHMDVGMLNDRYYDRTRRPSIMCLLGHVRLKSKNGPAYQTWLSQHRAHREAGAETGYLLLLITVLKCCLTNQKEVLVPCLCSVK